MATKKTKKPQLKRTNKSNTRKKPSPKIKMSKLSRKIAKFGRKKLFVVFCFAALAICALVFAPAYVSEMVASNDTNDSAVLASRPDKAQAFNVTESSITVSWETGLLNNGAKSHRVIWQAKAGPDMTLYRSVNIAKGITTQKDNYGEYTRQKVNLHYLHTYKIKGGLTKGTRYTIDIANINSSGYSDYVSTVSATTKGVQPFYNPYPMSYAKWYNKQGSYAQIKFDTTNRPNTVKYRIQCIDSRTGGQVIYNDRLEYNLSNLGFYITKYQYSYNIVNRRCMMGGAILRGGVYYWSAYIDITN